MRLKKELGASLGFVRKSMYGFWANCVTVGEDSKAPYFFSSLRGVTIASLSCRLLSRCSSRSYLLFWPKVCPEIFVRAMSSLFVLLADCNIDCACFLARGEPPCFVERPDRKVVLCFAASALRLRGVSRDDIVPIAS